MSEEINNEVIQEVAHDDLQHNATKENVRDVITEVRLVHDKIDTNHFELNNKITIYFKWIVGLVLFGMIIPALYSLIKLFGWLLS